MVEEAVGHGFQHLAERRGHLCARHWFDRTLVLSSARELSLDSQLVQGSLVEGHSQVKAVDERTDDF